MYSTRLANDKHSEKTPQNQTKPGDGLSEIWTKKGLIDMVTLGRSSNTKQQDGHRVVMTELNQQITSILTGKWWSGNTGDHQS